MWRFLFASFQAVEDSRRHTAPATSLASARRRGWRLVKTEQEAQKVDTVWLLFLECTCVCVYQLCESVIPKGSPVPRGAAMAFAAGCSRTVSLCPHKRAEIIRQRAILIFRADELALRLPFLEKQCGGKIRKENNALTHSLTHSQPRSWFGPSQSPIPENPFFSIKHNTEEKGGNSLLFSFFLFYFSCCKL